MRNMNRRLHRMQKQVRAQRSCSPNDELLWREVLTRLTDDELRSLRGALRRCIDETGYAPEDAPILERAQQLRDEVVSERWNP